MNVMVVQVPLDFNLLLMCDYIYEMGALVSSLFRVMFFPHEGRIVTIDQLSFVGPNLTPNQPTFLNVPYMQVVSPLPQINYVATCYMLVSTDDLVGNVVRHVLGALQPNFFIGSIDMYPFQCFVLPFDENLLKAKASFGL